MQRAVIIALLLLPGLASARDRKAYALETFEIVGDIQKPQVTLIINRKNLNTDASLELRESFVPKIIDSLEKKPF